MVFLLGGSQGYKEANFLPPPCQRMEVEGASGQPGESRPRSLSYQVNTFVITPPGGFPVGYIVIEARTRSPHEGVARSSSHESDPEGFASDRAMEARLGGVVSWVTGLETSRTHVASGPDISGSRPAAPVP